MADEVSKLEFEKGFMTLTDSYGRSTKYPIADMLSATDIPAGLTHTQVPDISSLANLLVVLIRTLIDRQVIDESFLENDDYDLDAIIYAIEKMGGAYHDPDIAV